MATFQYSSLPSLTSYLTTELNSLANGSRKLGAALDTAQATHAAVELDLAAQGSARSAGAQVEVYLLKSLDGGTDYDYGSDSLDPPLTTLVAVLMLDAATTARVVTAMFPLPGDLPFGKFLIKNSTGQAFAASATTFKYALYNLESA